MDGKTPKGKVIGSTKMFINVSRMRNSLFEDNNVHILVREDFWFER